MDVVQVTGILLIIAPVVMVALFLQLQRQFEYPGILRAPTERILLRFRVGGRRLIGLWYGFMLTAVLLVPVVVLLNRLLEDTAPDIVWLASTFGVLGAVTQFLGLLRWPFVVPYLAQIHADPSSSQATRDAATVVFQGLHRYLGVAVGEHLGYLFTGVWTILIATAMTASPLFHPWVAGLGIVPAVGILIGLLEPAGFKAAGAVNAVAYTAWALWLAATGATLLL